MIERRGFIEIIHLVYINVTTPFCNWIKGRLKIPEKCNNSGIYNYNDILP